MSLFPESQMPSPEQHRRQARHNEGVASKLEAIAVDWAITAYFYTAAHLARAYLAKRVTPSKITETFTITCREW
jgi:hypothetical protein